MNNPKITVLLPFYNAGKHLRRAAKSVLSSCYEDFELLLVDDGSNDEGVLIAEELTKQDGRTRLISQPHAGLVAALNLGLGRARAEFVARMDSDDICLPQRLGLQLIELESKPHISLTSCLVEALWDGPQTLGGGQYLKWVNACVQEPDLERALFEESPFPHPSVMFRKADVERLGGYRDYDGPEDYDLWLRMAEQGFRFSKVPKVLLQWRIHKSSFSRNHARYRRQAFLSRKFEFLASQLKKKKLGRGRALWIWGAGRHGGLLCRHLAEHGMRVQGFVDISPKKIGSTRQGLPIISYQDLPGGRGNLFYLGMVGSWGARPFIRNTLEEAGLAQGEDFVIL